MAMRYESIPLNITGPSYQDRSRPLTQQESRNIYPELIEEGKEKFILRMFPGLSLIDTATAGTDRGCHQMGEIEYRVVGQTLYKIDSLLLHVSLGTVPGTERCIFADDGINLFMVTGGSVYHYSSTTGLITKVTDADIDGAQSVAFINNQFLYTFPQLTVVSNVGDGTVASGANAINEESNGDDLVRDYVFDQIIYRFGKRTCPNWWNSGVGTPPIERVEGQIINIGLAAIHSVASASEYIYFLGSDLQIYEARGGNKEAVSSAAVAAAIQSYSVTSDAFAYTFTIDDKEIYIITFPTENKTWGLITSYKKRGWFELSDGITDGRYNINSFCSVHNKVLAGHKSNGELYELDFNKYTLNGSPWRRRRVTNTINGDVLNMKGKRMQMHRFELICEKGTGTISGQGEDPKIMIEYSKDGGKSWSTGTWMRIGRQGETNIKAEWFKTMKFYNLTIRLTTSDPVAYNWYSAVIDIKPAGW